MTRIVHASDLHFGPQFQRDVFDLAVEEINSLDPDLMVITGDLSEDGLISQLREARDGIKRFRAGDMVVLSGNHDYRSTGYLPFKRFFGFKRVFEGDGFVLISLSTARPDRDEGEVGYRQGLWLERELSKLSKRDGLTKIVAMHHHLLPIPDTGPDRLTIIDAGDVLQTLIEGGVDLLLCGHRHRPWKWSVEGMEIAHAGSLSSARLRGFFANSYNVIDLKGGEARIRLKVVGGEELDFKELKRARVDYLGI
ncbi:MAG: metallophosphoesterase family protein [Candidatus Bathyarchaeia archaeon]